MGQDQVPTDSDAEAATQRMVEDIKTRDPNFKADWTNHGYFWRTDKKWVPESWQRRLKILLAMNRVFWGLNVPSDLQQQIREFGEQTNCAAVVYVNCTRIECYFRESSVCTFNAFGHVYHVTDYERQGRQYRVLETQPM